MRRLFHMLALLVAAVRAPAAEQPVSLPYAFHDASGSNWDVQYDGSIGDGGNDLYDGGGHLFLNGGAQYNAQVPQATLDESRNELTLPVVAIAGLNISRKVAVFSALSTVRFTEIVDNPTAAAVRVQLRVNFNMGGSVQQALPLVDPKRPRQIVGYAIADQNNSVAMVGAGRTSKLVPAIAYRQNDDNVDLTYDVEVPPRKGIVVVHFQIRRPTATEAAEAWAGIRERDLLKDLPRDLRKRVVNFPSEGTFAGELEVLRGDGLDVVELRGGDVYRGTLKVERYRVQTPYGPITLPADKVVGVINTGTSRPTPLVVTADGQIVGGRLEGLATVPLQLAGGYVMQIPLARVTRIGYRKRPGEPEEWNFENKPLALLRVGDRLRVKPPGSPFELATPFGPVQLRPGVVASVVFQGEDVTVPEVRLTDGSRLSGLFGAPAFDLTLVGLGPDQRARVPTAAVTRLDFAPAPEPDFMDPAFVLANGDPLVGTIAGTVSLETPFDTIHVEGPQIKALVHTKSGDHDVRITLWDDSTLSGRLVESHVTCLLRCGVSLRVPIPLVDRYDQPLALPSPPMIERIRRTARELDAPEWKTRQGAQDELLALGPPVMPVLQALRPTASDEAGQRIDIILNYLTAALDRTPAPASPQPNSEIDHFLRRR